MKAMVLKTPAPVETRPLVCVERPNPVPGPKEVLVRVRACAVCRTDLHIVEGELPPVKPGIVPGHQAVGIVEAVGSGCRRFSKGARVGIAWLRFTCGSCRFCKQGLENLCENSRFTGYHEDGGYAELTVVPEDYAYEIPAGMNDKSAAPLLCAGIIGYRALKKSGFKPGGRIALFGFGGSAHVVIQIVRHMKGEVYVVTRGKEHAELARKLGATWAGPKAADIPVKMESAILFAPSGALVPEALAALEKGGTLVSADIYMSAIPSLDYEKHLFYEKTMRSVTANTREDGRELLALAAEIPIRTETTMYPLMDANRALQDLKAGRISGSAVLVP